MRGGLRRESCTRSPALLRTFFIGNVRAWRVCLPCVERETTFVFATRIASGNETGFEISLDVALDFALEAELAVADVRRTSSG